MEIKVGDILAANWGYNCSRWSFYKVTRLTESNVWFYKIGKKYISGAPNHPCATVVPYDCQEGKEIHRRRHADYVSISKYEHAFSIHTDGRTYEECCD